MGRQSHEESAPFGTNQLGPVRSLLFPKREREIPGLVNVDSPVARRGLLKRSRSSSSSTGQEERQVPRRLLLREDITEINEENFHQRCEQSFVELTEKLHIWKNACCHSLKALWEETHGLEPYPLEYYAWFATANDFDFTTTWEDLKSFSIQYSIANMETPLLRSKATFPIPGLKSVAGHDSKSILLSVLLYVSPIFQHCFCNLYFLDSVLRSPRWLPNNSSGNCSRSCYVHHVNHETAERTWWNRSHYQHGRFRRFYWYYFVLRTSS